MIIYLAGKISSNDWRASILGYRPGGVCDIEEFLDPHIEPPLWPIKEGAIFGTHAYGGPYFISCDHGCAHGSSTHGVGAHDGEPPPCIDAMMGHGRSVPTRREVARLCLEAVRDSDLIFAYLTSTDAHGTLVEIGFALALGRRVAIAWDPRVKSADVWFALAAGADVIGPMLNPADGLRLAIDRAQAAK